VIFRISGSGRTNFKWDHYSAMTKIDAKLANFDSLIVFGPKQLAFFVGWAPRPTATISIFNFWFIVKIHNFKLGCLLSDSRGVEMSLHSTALLKIYSSK
jgi:hypothetical protein